MTIELAARRMTELAEAFRAFEPTVPGLSVEVVGRMAGAEHLVHPVAGFHVWLEEPADEGGVSLYVSGSYAELTRWGDSGAIRERFTVQLDEEFAWGDSVYSTARELAHDLLGYLQFNLDVIAR